MAISGFRHIPCGAPVNESERLAIERLKAKLQSLHGPWVLLSNVKHSTAATYFSDEIDQIIIGPPGVFVVEVKHWEAQFIKQHPDIAAHEAEKTHEKAKRVAGKLQKEFNPGFVMSSFLLTRPGTGIHAGQRIKVNGVPVFGLGEWKELLRVDGVGQLNAVDIERAVGLLVPTAKVAMSGGLRNFAGLINLERRSASDDAFHRIYRGQHPTRRDKVMLHLYDLSATDEKDAKNLAMREFDVIQRWQRSPYLPLLLDSFQEVGHYPGELYYFSLVDPGAPSLAERAKDSDWSLDDRLRFAREALLALAQFHQPDEEDQPPLVHRHINPTNLRVRHNGKPLFTDFSLARLSDAQTISAAPHDFGPYADYVAPEVLQGGLSVADAKSDVFALCKTLLLAFDGDDTKSAEARGFLEQGCATNPEGREKLLDLAAVLERNTAPAITTTPPLPAPKYWDEDTVVPFQHSNYKIVGRLGGGGIGETFKVVEVDGSSNELYGTYVAKLIYNKDDAEGALRAYRKARAYTIHPHLSAIHEVTPEWRRDRFASLLKWVEGIPLADLTGVLSLHSEELEEVSLEDLVLRWLNDLCDALWSLHRMGLVHGDVSPRNIIVQGGEVVLTDYDTVSDTGSKPRQRNPLYASQAVESLTRIVASDDIFALAAGMFHVLFEKDPFLFGAQRDKTHGLNWGDLQTNGLERVVAFLNHATAAIESERFDDAHAAKAFLAAQMTSDEPDAPAAATAPLAPVLSEQVVPRLAELLSAYPGSRYGNAETRGLDSPFSQATYVPTRLDAMLKDQIENDQVNLVILFGNAGDGKTAFVQNLLHALDTPDVHSRHRLMQRRLQDGRIVHVNLDGSAAWQGKSANALLDEFLHHFHELTFDGQARHPRVLAINSGKLLEWLETQDETPLTEALYRSLFDTNEDANPQPTSPRIRLIDLNQRSLVGGINGQQVDTEFLLALLDRFLGTDRTPDPWQPCSTCSAQHRCTAWHSVRTLRDATLGDQVRNRLADALQACHLRGEVHITARELRAALIFTFFGVDDCAALHADPELTPPGYWDRAFSARASQRQGDLLGELARFDPALDCDPLIDRQLLRAAPGGVDKAEVLASARRRAWFEWPDERYAALHLTREALPLFGGKHLDYFRRVPLMAPEERSALCRELCMGIARLEDLPPAAFVNDLGVPLRIQPRTPTESAFWVLKPWDRFELEVRLPPDTEGLEVLHTRVLLTYRYANSSQEILPIGLELFHLLLALKDGAQLAGTGQEGIFAHLEIFTQRLAQEDSRELCGWHASQEDNVSRIRIRARDGRQILTREVP